MPTERHTTIIEVKPDDREFDRAVDRQQAKIDRLSDTAGNIGFGTGGGGAARRARGAGVGPGGGGRNVPGGSGAGEALAARARFGPLAGAMGGAAIGGMMGGMAGGPAAMIGAAGGAAVGGLNMLRAHMSAIARREETSERMRGIMGAISDIGIPIFGAMLGGGAALLGGGFAMRARLAEERGRIQLQQHQAALYGRGFGIDYLAAAGQMGYDPMEAGQLRLEFLRQAGFRGVSLGGTTNYSPGGGGIGAAMATAMGERSAGAMALPNFLRAHRAGVSIGAMAGYAGLGAPGVADQFGGGNFMRAIRIAFAEGLRGARVDQFLQVIASGVDQMATQGMSVNVSDVEIFTRRTALAAKGAGESAGLRAPRFAMNLMQGAAGARQQLLAPFAGLAQNAALAMALQQPGGIAGAADYLGQNMGPTAMLRAMRAIFGPELTALYARTAGLGPGTAEAVARGLPTYKAAGPIPTVEAPIMGVSGRRRAMRIMSVGEKEAVGIVAIQEATKDKKLEDYAADALLRAAVERHFEIIGEAVGRIARAEPGVAAGISGAPQIVAFRNVLIHGYDLIDDEQVWRVVQNDLPSLIETVRELRSEGD